MCVCVCTHHRKWHKSNLPSPHDQDHDQLFLDVVFLDESAHLKTKTQTHLLCSSAGQIGTPRLPEPESAWHGLRSFSAMARPQSAAHARHSVPKKKIRYVVRFARSDNLMEALLATCARGTLFQIDHGLISTSFEIRS